MTEIQRFFNELYREFGVKTPQKVMKYAENGGKPFRITIRIGQYGFVMEYKPSNTLFAHPIIYLQIENGCLLGGFNRAEYAIAAIRRYF